MDDSRKANLSLAETEAIIAAHPFFSGLSSKDFKDLAALMKTYLFDKGHVVVKENDYIDRIYLVAEGEAEVTQETVSHGESVNRPIAILRHGEAIGLTEEGLFAQGEQRTATVTALTPMILIGVSLPELNAFMRSMAESYSDFKKSIEKIMWIDFVKKTLPFAPLNIQDIHWLVDHLEHFTVPADSYIFEQGKVGTSAYLIQSGRVEISRTIDDGNRTVLAILQAPEIFGETSLLTGARRNASALALEKCELLGIQKKYLNDILKRNEKTQEILEAIVRERSAPVKVREPHVFRHQDVAGDSFVILKNEYDHLYCMLSNEGWYVWEQIDGKRLIDDIIAECSKKFGHDAKESVYTALTNLVQAKLVTLPTAPKFSTGNLPWWKKIWQQLQ